MIIISAGHSNQDPGATGQGLKEAEVCADFRNIVAFYLKEAGVAYRADGEGTVNKSLNDAGALISGPKDIAVEFHLNAGPATATGVETLSAPRHYPLGKRICETVSSVLGIPNRGAKPEDSGQHKTLFFVQKGGIIVELFFISSVSDLKVYQEKKWLLAKALAAVLIEANK